MKKTLAGFTLSSVILVFTAAPSAHADDSALPHQQVIAAIQTAISAYPGQVQEVDVEKKSGKMVVEVKITGSDGKEKELQIDPEKNQVIR